MTRAIASLLAVALICACASEPAEPPKPKPKEFVAPTGDELHAPLTALLAAHVDEKGEVDYAGLKAKSAELQKYLDTLNFTKASTLNKTEQLAYWINAYNAFTLKLILDYYPGIKSIMDIPKLPVDKRWGAKVHAAGGEYYSLDEIEKKILLVEFDEPRVHFAINCASKSCPTLRNEAYVPSRIEEQLADAATTFLGDTFRGVEIDAEKKTLRVTMLFKWYVGDFTKGGTRVVDYIKANAAADVVTRVDALGADPKIEYLNYDWSLNGK